MQKFQEIAGLGSQELMQELEKALAELHELRLANRMHQLKETHKIALMKRKIAHIHTALKQPSGESLPVKNSMIAEEVVTDTPKKKSSASKKAPVKKAKKSTVAKKTK